MTDALHPIRQPGASALLEPDDHARDRQVSDARSTLAAGRLVLDGLGLSGTSLWRTSSIMVLLSGLAAGAHLARQVRSLEAGAGRSLNYGFVLWVIAAVSCLANAAGWPWPPNGGVYLLTVWAIVGVAGGNFVELLFRKVL